MLPSKVSLHLLKFSYLNQRVDCDGARDNLFPPGRPAHGDLIDYFGIAQPDCQLFGHAETLLPRLFGLLYGFQAPPPG